MGAGLLGVSGNEVPTSPHGAGRGNLLADWAQCRPGSRTCWSNRTRPTGAQNSAENCELEGLPRRCAAVHLRGMHSRGGVGARPRSGGSLPDPKAVGQTAIGQVETEQQVFQESGYPKRRFLATHFGSTPPLPYARAEA